MTDNVPSYEEYQKFVERVQTQATAYDPTQRLTDVPEEAIVDDQPALAAVDAQFDTAVSDVDLSDMPPVRDMKRMLPAQRMRARAQLLELRDLEEKLPESFKSGGTADVTAEEFEVVCDMMDAAERLVLGQAEDRDAMEKWLLNSDNSDKALFAAMAQIAKRLGN